MQLNIAKQSDTKRKETKREKNEREEGPGREEKRRVCPSAMPLK